MQTLDVTEGNVLKPKGWFYRYGGAPQSIVWTISKESPQPDGYKTGLRIVLFPAVSKTMKKSPEAFAYVQDSSEIFKEIKKDLNRSE